MLRISILYDIMFYLMSSSSFIKECHRLLLVFFLKSCPRTVRGCEFKYVQQKNVKNNIFLWKG